MPNDPQNRMPTNAPTTIADMASGARKRLLRLEELRHSLNQKDPKKQTYALQTLLSLLWVEEGVEQIAVAHTLLGYAPLTGKAEAAPAAGRLCARLQRAFTEDLPPPPPLPELRDWIERALRTTLTESVTTLKAMSGASHEPALPSIQHEVDTCLDLLALARCLQTSEAAEACVRLMRLFPPDRGREVGSLARQTMPLREAACRTLGALSSEALFPLWYTLGSPDETARRDLLPALDYIRCPHIIPNLVKLLERREQWQDGEMVGWFIVRAFARIGDRAALPALRRVAAGSGKTGWRGALPWARSTKQEGAQSDLAREARRVIMAIEYGTGGHEGDSLLRPCQTDNHQLLQPAIPAGDADREAEKADLLRATEAPLPPTIPEN